MKRHSSPLFCKLKLHLWRRLDDAPWLVSCTRCGELRRIDQG